MGLKQVIGGPLTSSMDSSGGGARRASPSKTNSMLFGEDPLEKDFGPRSLLLGSVRRHREPGAVLLRQLTRNYYSLPIEPKVCPFLLLQLFPTRGKSSISTKSAPIVVVFTKYDLLVRTKMVELSEDNPGLGQEYLDNQSKEEARKHLAKYTQLLSRTSSAMRIPVPPIVNVSGIISDPLFNQCHG